MAAPQWTGGKSNSIQEAKARLRHNAKDRRQYDGHKNPHIDRRLTKNNFSYYGLTYEQLCEKYDRRMAAIDQGRQREGRVVMQSLIVYPPKDMTPERQNEWLMDAGRVIAERYGDNFIDMCVDTDERHEYIDARTGETVMSRNHGHAHIVPEVNGKLDCFHFSTRKEINALNKALDEMSRQKYGVPMIDGTGRKGGRTVEELKALSEAAGIEAKARQLDEEIAKAQQLQAELNRRAGENAAREDELSDREGKADARKKALDEREKALDDREKRLKAREDVVEKREEALRTPQKASESTRTAETVQNTPEQPKTPQKASSGLTGAKTSDIDPALLELLGGGTEISMDEAERLFRTMTETPQKASESTRTAETVQNTPEQPKTPQKASERPTGAKMRELNRAVAHTDEYEAAKQEQARKDDGDLRQFLRHSTR